jgi:hypothetical protein
VVSGRLESSLQLAIRFPILRSSFRRCIGLREGSKIGTCHQQRNNSAANDWGPLVFRTKKQRKRSQIWNIHKDQIDRSFGHDPTDTPVLIRYRISKWMREIVVHQVHTSKIPLIRKEILRAAIVVVGDPGKSHKVEICGSDTISENIGGKNCNVMTGALEILTDR